MTAYDRVIRVLRSSDSPLSIHEICYAIKASETPVRLAISRLLEDDIIHVAGKRKRESGHGTMMSIYAYGEAQESELEEQESVKQEEPATIPAYVPYDFAIRALMGIRS